DLAAHDDVVADVELHASFGVQLHLFSAQAEPPGRIHETRSSVRTGRPSSVDTHISCTSSEVCRRTRTRPIRLGRRSSITVATVHIAAGRRSHGNETRSRVFGLDTIAHA